MAGTISREPQVEFFVLSLELPVMSVQRPSSVSSDVEKKVDIEHTENVPSLNDEHVAGSSSSKTKDAALEILGNSKAPVHVTPEQDRAVLRKIDLWLMPVICMVYFLQQLDK